MTFTSLFSCLVTCSSGRSSTFTTIVIRDTSRCSVGPTASDSMLNPRRLNSPATRASTPGLFSTSTDSVCLLMESDRILVEDGAHAARRQDLVVTGAGRNHRPHLGVLADHEVDHHRGVVHRHRLLNRRVDVLFG